MKFKRGFRDRALSSLVRVIDGYLKGSVAARTEFESEEFRELLAVLARQFDVRNEPDYDAMKYEDAQFTVTDASGRALAQMMVDDVASAKSAMKDLRRWLAGAEAVTICDPYLLHPASSRLYGSDDDYVEFVVRLLPASAKQVKLFGCGFTTKIKSLLLRRLKEGRRVQCFDANEIHDRYVIRDNQDARMLGASFGGLGSKISTVLPLPPEDVVVLLYNLAEIERKARGS